MQMVNVYFSTVFSLTVLAAMVTGRPAAAENDVVDVWLGTSSASPSKGIYHCMLNTATGKLSAPTLMAEISGPGFLAMHPTLPRIYAVGGIDGKPCVAAYSITGTCENASLKFLNSIEIGDGGAAHVSVDSTGHTILTAQYGGGSTGVFSLNADGSLKERTQLIKHVSEANSKAPDQAKSHAHCRIFTGQSLCICT